LTLRPTDPGLARALGVAYSILGRKDEAAAVYREWLAREPENAVARHMLAACSGEGVPTRASDACIVQMFDAFANTFDVKLAQLGYRAPELCAVALAAVVAEPARNLVVLDAGCGTGLCGPLLAPYAARLVGVDLSGPMLARARAGGHYDELVQAELTEYLARSRERFQLIVSADTFIYFGALEEVLGAARGALLPGGILIISVESASAADRGHAPSSALAEPEGGPGYHLDAYGRYCHSERYLNGALEGAGFRLRGLEPGVIRTEAGAPVHGLVVTALAG
jgi:predicted TPR repeat methyltransferase